MSPLTPIVWAWMRLLAPDTQNVELADAIAAVCEVGKPLHRGDVFGEHCAATLTAIAFRESTFVHGKVGDHGNARCEFQLWAAPGVETNRLLCATVAKSRVRESMMICQKGNELCLYAAGPRGLDVAREKTEAITRDRFALAKWLLTNSRKGK